MPDVFEGILGQPQVREFLRQTIAHGRATHAYLFTGPAGSNKTTAAYAFAQALLCEKGGCGSCDTCIRIRRRTHPDVHYYAPAGAHGYLVDQIREIVSDATLAPIRACRKVYILDRVDQLGTQAANAFLKTLEEPEGDVTFILLGRTRDAVLPTLVSRCQVVPFRFIPASEAAGILSQNTGVTIERARIAIEACGGSLTQAIQFASSSERMSFRSRVLEVLHLLPQADERDVLEYAQDLIERARAPLDEVRTAQAEELADSSEFLASAALKQIEARHKRALSAATVQSLFQLTSIVRSWLRDVLAVSSSAPDRVVNLDDLEAIQHAASTATPASLVDALREAQRTDEAIRYNVSPETCIDVLLFTIRKAIYGSGCSY